MQLLRTPAATARAAARWQRTGREVVLVPTMGALHAGHLALVNRARRVARHGGVVVVSIFVNPLQFGPREDLSRYPRPLARDLALCRERGVDAVFHPAPEQMYATDRSVTVEETLLSSGLCGHSRPGHFRGVGTVVAKLFNLLRPNVAVFGMKDFQQLAIIRRMVRDLNFPVRILPHPTVREPDGLAMSSRNAYLGPEERRQAPAIRRALLVAAGAARAGENSAEKLREIMRNTLREDAPLASLDYLEVVDAESLQEVSQLTGPTLLAAAVYFGKTRLIDNELIESF